MGKDSKVKNVMITLTPHQIEKLEELSVELFGKSNRSGYLQIMIEREYNKLKRQNE